MVYLCEDIIEQIEETVQEPVEEWIEEREEQCEQQECNWLLLCANKVVCWVVVTLVKIVTWITITVVKSVTRTVCEVVSVPVIYTVDRIQPVLCAFGLYSGDSSSFDPEDALLFAKLSEAAYADPTDIDVVAFAPDLIGRAFFSASTSTGGYPVDTQVYVFEDPAADRIIVAFRGTEGWEGYIDWLNNLSAVPVPYGTTNGVVHGGFLAAYEAVRPQLSGAVSTALTAGQSADDPVREVCFTGHSLGGALATLAALDHRIALSDDIEVMNYTFGAPMVGNRYVVFDYDGRIPNSYRVVNQGDPVPEFPVTGGPTKYRHVEHLVHFSSDGESGEGGGDGEMSIEPCPRPATDWANELAKYLPPGADITVSGLDALATLGASALEGLPQHGMDLYISNLQTVVDEEGE